MAFRVNRLAAVMMAGLIAVLGSDAAAQPGEETLERGAALYRQGNFADAITMIQEAAPAIAGDREKASAHFLLGMIHLARDHVVLAGEEFDRVVALDPKRRLSPGAHPPIVIHLFAQARTRTLGAIVVRTTPPDAEVYLDGRLAGLTPASIEDLPIGVHMVRIIKSGYNTENREVEVIEAERGEYYLELSILDEEPAVIDHDPVTAAREQRSTPIRAEVKDNTYVDRVELHYRTPGGNDYTSAVMRRIGRDMYEGVVPRGAVTAEGLRYYISAVDSGGNTAFEGAPEAPFAVEVEELDKEPPNPIPAPAPASSPGKPDAPANVQVVSSGVRSISLAWNRHPDREITAYRLYRHTAAEGDFKIVKEIQGRTVTEYTDRERKGESLEDGQVYYYRLTAVRSGEVESELSDPVSAATPCPPAPPAGLQASSLLAGEIVITWVPVDGDEVAGYAVYRGESPGDMKPIASLRGRAASRYEDAGEWGAPLEDGKTYYYTVKSVNAMEMESRTPHIIEGATKPGPSAPTGVNAERSGKGNIMVSWPDNPEPDIAIYRILRSTSRDGKYRTLATTQETAYEDLGLKRGASYYYMVRAVDHDNLASALSNRAVVRTKPLPAPPKGLEAYAAKSSVTLSWEKSAEPDIDYYVIYSVGMFGKQKVGKSRGAAHIVEKLEPGASYTFVVVAVNKDGLASQPSGPAHATTYK